ncbi:hypothetical protein [Brevibacterium album]|uniref:hypothetical protein n=1 Tax=Brevibacterium album TaxID=417948 RepID=UPI0004034827|nr:hypothetical protein [Brevibacterium album]
MAAVLAAAALCGPVALLSLPAREALVRAFAESALGRVFAPLADPLFLLLVGITGVLVVVTWLRNRQRFWILVAAARPVAARLSRGPAAQPAAPPAGR